MIKMKYNKWLILLILYVTVIYVQQCNADTITINAYPQESTATVNPAIITLSGKIYTEDIWLEDVAAGTAQAAPDETFIAQVINANKTGTPAEVLSTWNPDEQEKMGTYINDPNLFTASQTWYGKVIYSAPLAKVSFGEYTVFVIQHSLQDSSNVARLYPIKSVSGQYYMTNELSNDPMFVYYMIKIQDQVAFKTKPQP